MLFLPLFEASGKDIVDRTSFFVVRTRHLCGDESDKESGEENVDTDAVDVRERMKHWFDNRMESPASRRFINGGVKGNGKKISWKGRNANDCSFA